MTGQLEVDTPLATVPSLSTCDGHMTGQSCSSNSRWDTFNAIRYLHHHNPVHFMQLSPYRKEGSPRSTQSRIHTTILRPFFRDHPGKPVPRANFWTLSCKGRLTETDTLTIRLGATLSGLTSAHLHHPIFYRPDALPADQPTVSKHWSQKGNKLHKPDKFTNTQEGISTTVKNKIVIHL